MVKLWSKLHSRWYRYEQSGWLHGKWNLAGPVKSEYRPLLVLEIPLLRSSYPGCTSVGFTVAACNIAELLTMNANANPNTSHSLMPD